MWSAVPYKMREGTDVYMQMARCPSPVTISSLKFSVTKGQNSASPCYNPMPSFRDVRINNGTLFWKGRLACTLILVVPLFPLSPQYALHMASFVIKTHENHACGTNKLSMCGKQYSPRPRKSAIPHLKKIQQRVQRISTTCLIMWQTNANIRVFSRHPYYVWKKN